MSVQQPQPDPSRPPMGDALLQLVMARLVAAEADEFDQPHIVLVAGGQFTTYEGPYPDALTALMAAADEEAALEAEDGLTISIAPLLAPRRSG